VFRETNITCLGQLNALAETQGIASLTIEPEGNTVTERTWRHYAIYRLSHWGLKQINGTEISDEEQRTADNMYAGLADLVLWSLPESLLQPLLLRLRLNETCAASRMTAKEWLAADRSLKSVVGKEALQWKKLTGPVQDEAVVRQRGKVCFNQMLENTCNVSEPMARSTFLGSKFSPFLLQAVEKLQRLDKLWDTMLFEIVRNALIDYSQIDAYVRNLLNELK
jgi:leucine-rich repeat-containing protein 49